MKLTVDETLATIGREFAAIQLVPYHSRNFHASRSLLDSLRSVQLAKRFVTEYALPRARAGECVIVAARGNWAWKLRPEENVVAYVNAECRAARLGPATRGGKAILAHYAGERVSAHPPVRPPRQPRPQPQRAARPPVPVSPSDRDFGDPRTIVPVIDQLVDRFEISGEDFQRLHHWKNRVPRIRDFRKYCMTGPKRFKAGDLNEQTACRLAYCLERLEAGDPWHRAVAAALARHPK